MPSKANEDKLGHDPLEWLASPEGHVPEVKSSETDGMIESQDVNSEKQEAQKEDTILVLDEDALTVPHIEKLHQRLLETLAKHPQSLPLKLNLEKAIQMDSSGYQLLLSLVKTCSKRNISLQLLGMGDELTSLKKLFGDNQLGQVCHESN